MVTSAEPTFAVEVSCGLLRGCWAQAVTVSASTALAIKAVRQIFVIGIRYLFVWDSGAERSELRRLARFRAASNDALLPENNAIWDGRQADGRNARTYFPRLVVWR